MKVIHEGPEDVILGLIRATDCSWTSSGGRQIASCELDPVAGDVIARFVAGICACLVAAGLSASGSSGRLSVGVGD